MTRTIHVHRWLCAPLLVAIAALAAPLGAQEPAGAEPAASAPDPAAPTRLLALFDRARRASEAGDTAALVAALDTAARIAPDHPHALYHLARVQAHAGRADSALALLRRLAPLGAGRDIGADAVFAPLRRLSGFAAARRQLLENGEPLVGSDTALLIPGADAVESIAYDPATGEVYAGSAVRHRIVRVAEGGRRVRAMVQGSREMGPILAMRVDAPRGMLWVATSVREAAAGDEAGLARAVPALVAYDLAAGEERWRATLEEDSGAHRFEDLAIAGDGTVYATDGEGNAVYALRPGAGSLARVIGDDPQLSVPRGIAVAPRGGMLYVAHAEGISLVDPATGARTRLRPSRYASTTTIGGLYAVGDWLVGIQQGVELDQVIALRVRDGAVCGQRVLERRHPAYDDPAAGVTVGHDLLYIANGARPGVRGTVVLRVALPAGGGGC